MAGVKINGELFSGIEEHIKQVRTFVGTLGLTINDLSNGQDIFESEIWKVLMSHIEPELKSQNKHDLFQARLTMIQQTGDDRALQYVIDALVFSAGEPKRLVDDLFSCDYSGTGRFIHTIPKSLMPLALLSTKIMGKGADIGCGELLLPFLLSTDVKWFTNNAPQDVHVGGYSYHVKAITSRSNPARGGLRSWPDSGVYNMLIDAWNRGVLKGQRPIAEMSLTFVKQNATEFITMFGSLQNFADQLTREGRELGLPNSHGMMFFNTKEETIEFVPIDEVYVARVSQSAHGYTTIKDKMIKGLM